MNDELRYRLCYAILGKDNVDNLTAEAESEGQVLMNAKATTLEEGFPVGESKIEGTGFKLNDEWVDDINLTGEGVEYFEQQLQFQLKEVDFTVLASFSVRLFGDGEEGGSDPFYSLKVLAVDNKENNSPLYIIGHNEMRKNGAMKASTINMASFPLAPEKITEITSATAAREFIKAINSNRVYGMMDLLEDIGRFDLDMGRITELAAGRMPSSMVNFLTSMVKDAPRNDLPLDLGIQKIEWAMAPQDQDVIMLTAHLESGKSFKHTLSGKNDQSLIHEGSGIKLPVKDVRFMILKTVHHKGAFSGTIYNSLAPESPSPKVSHV